MVMRRMTNLRAGIAFAGIAMVVPGCIETDIPPAGSYSEVLVVTEDGRRDPLSRMLHAQLARRLDFFVASEPQFKLEDIAAAQLTATPYFKNIVICGVASPETHVGQGIRGMLGGTVTADALAGRANIFKKEDLPGPGQTTIIVTGAATEAIEAVLDARGDEIVEALEQSCRKRVRSYLLARPDADLTRQLHQRYGFTLHVPAAYHLLSESLDPAGIELLRDGPSRVLGVFWLDWPARPALEQRQGLFRARADYVFARYDGDQMDSTRVRFSYAMLGDYPALKMEGYWSNSRALAGGYYMTYFVYDEPGKLLWAVDLVVFAPGLPKHPLFRELLALAETFRYD